MSNADLIVAWINRRLATIDAAAFFESRSSNARERMVADALGAPVVGGVPGLDGFEFWVEGRSGRFWFCVSNWPDDVVRVFGHSDRVE